MNLRKIILYESLVFFILVLGLINVLNVVPQLQPSQVNGKFVPYTSTFILENNINLAENDLVILPFKYSTYDPAIFLLQINILDCEIQGYISIYCNYRKITSLFIDSNNIKKSFILFSFSGSDWVEPPRVMFGLNELLFMSDSSNGFAGELNCSIAFRGTR